MKKAINKVISLFLVFLLFGFNLSASALDFNSIDITELERNTSFSNTHMYYYKGNNITLFESNYKDKRSVLEGAAFYHVDDDNKTITFYGGDGTVQNMIYSNVYEPFCFRMAGITDNENIEHIIFTDDYTVNRYHLVGLVNLKDIIILNNAEITPHNVSLGDSSQKALTYRSGFYTIYGTNESHRELAEAVNHPYHDLNDVELCAAEDTTVSIDSTKNLITGLTPKTGADTFVKNDLAPKACDAIINSDTEYVGTGDKVNLVKWLDDSDAGSYDILLYGDVDGDGIYDARDAYLVNLMANGILTEDQVGSLKWSAADCNHDGEVNASDVLILEQAGLMLANVDQTKSGDELQEDASFIDYVELIDQTPAADEVTEEKPASIFDRIIEFIKNIIDFVKSFIVKF